MLPMYLLVSFSLSIGIWLWQLCYTYVSEVVVRIWMKDYTQNKLVENLTSFKPFANQEQIITCTAIGEKFLNITSTFTNTCIIREWIFYSHLITVRTTTQYGNFPTLARDFVGFFFLVMEKWVSIIRQPFYYFFDQS